MAAKIGNPSGKAFGYSGFCVPGVNIGQRGSRKVGPVTQAARGAARACPLALAAWTSDAPPPPGVLLAPGVFPEVGISGFFVDLSEHFDFDLFLHCIDKQTKVGTGHWMNRLVSKYTVKGYESAS